MGTADQDDDDDDDRHHGNVARGRWKILRDAIRSSRQPQQHNNSEDDTNNHNNKYSIHHFPGYQMIPSPQLIEERSMNDTMSGIYYLRDTSRFGSYVLTNEARWIKVHAGEFPLQSGMQLKFGSEEGQILEFRIED